ncbi:MAG: hypothetical protein ACRYG5_05590 [Janthinobacterium lividum]
MTLCSALTACLPTPWSGPCASFQSQRRVNHAAEQFYAHHAYDLEAAVSHIENWLQLRLFMVGFSDWHCGGRLHDSHAAPALGAVAVIESERDDALSLGLFYRGSQGSVRATMEARREDRHLALRGITTIWLQLMHAAPSRYARRVLAASDGQVASFCDAVLRYQENVIVRCPRNPRGAEHRGNYQGLDEEQTRAKALLIATERLNFAGREAAPAASLAQPSLPVVNDIADSAGLSVGQIRDALSYDNRLTPAGFELICEHHLTRFVDSEAHGAGYTSDASNASDKSDTLFSKFPGQAFRTVSESAAALPMESESLL